VPKIFIWSAKNLQGIRTGMAEYGFERELKGLILFLPAGSSLREVDFGVQMWSKMSATAFWRLGSLAL
jgi:hypothetical protein